MKYAECDKISSGDFVYYEPAGFCEHNHRSLAALLRCRDTHHKAAPPDMYSTTVWCQWDGEEWVPVPEDDIWEIEYKDMASKHGW